MAVAEIDLERRLEVAPAAVVGEVRDERLEREDAGRPACRRARRPFRSPCSPRAAAVAALLLDRGRRLAVLRRAARERADAEVPERGRRAREDEHAAPDQRDSLDFFLGLRLPRLASRLLRTCALLANDGRTGRTRGCEPKMQGPCPRAGRRSAARKSASNRGFRGGRRAAGGHTPKGSQKTGERGVGEAPRPALATAAYRTMLIRSFRSVSLEVMTRALAWKLRWVEIRSMNSCAMATFESSTAPATMLPRPPDCGVPIAGEPESTDSR